MKDLIVFVAIFVFVFSACIFAAERPSATPAKNEAPKAVSMKPHKETRVSITGVVKEISDTVITVERTVKGKTETVGFFLEKPLEQIKVGEKVRVSYVKREDKYVAIRVTPFTVKIIKKVTPLKERKPSPVEPAKK